MATKAATVSSESMRTVKEETPFAIVMRRFRKHRLAMISLGVMIFIFLVSLFAQQIAPFEPDEVDVNARFVAPGTTVQGKLHLFGTDNIGRDYFSRLLYAGRISLTVAVLSVLISELIGIVIGSISGFYGGWIDTILMRFVEFLLTIPSLPLLLIVSSMLIRNPDLIPIPDVVLNVLGKVMLLRPSDARQAVLIVIVLAGLGWLTSAQLMRGMILTLREQTFVEAARSLGASNTRIIFVHMIPNALAPIIVDASLALAGYIVAEASLSFLGFGIQDPIPTWGNMLSATQTYMYDRPWLPLIPGLPIFLCSLAFNYIGDGLRDALDPRLKQ
ncbi:ABC transporter permease [Anaerolinea thermophila]|uniref:ABC transporter permease protein n=1 Tax=Anaerolinea thermophila (strain DSM 14523 / JCM 11388 / NBRC 100420 / UNI-1) TaxID=926569 RepID=E8MZ30_ANATU|nr:ABC transporter permease [Anaerolinea thermophila]BAJ62173.1 putative ABC transporter permease protein [Anaerolinea thermophila UNI-1]